MPVLALLSLVAAALLTISAAAFEIADLAGTAKILSGNGAPLPYGADWCRARRMLGSLATPETMP